MDDLNVVRVKGKMKTIYTSEQLNNQHHGFNFILKLLVIQHYILRFFEPRPTEIPFDIQVSAIDCQPEPV